MTSVPVLIVGAGPTGLVLALSLARRGIPFRIISDDHGPGEHSRAVVVHARTLEFYDQFGFADEVVAGGIKAEATHIRRADDHGHIAEVVQANFADLGEGLSAYPFLLSYPQDDHERFLVAKLAELGVQIEWNTRLIGFTQTSGGVSAEIARADGPEMVEVAYICGCDGAHSQVRHSLGIGFPGGTYDQRFYVVDARIAGGFKPDFFVTLGESILALMLPVRSSGMQRLIGIVPPNLIDKPDLSFEDIREPVERLTGIRIEEVNWFSAYKVHHRVADRFQQGRAFLLGDAGHIHSPAGGQGMNTGIGDAINLGWKLAHVIEGRAPPSLLDSYEEERLPFAHSLIATTDSAFNRVVDGGWRGQVIRRFIAPLGAHLATRFTWSRHAAFRLVSQIRLNYHGSSLSAGEVGGVVAGDRLPWTGAVAMDNFASLRSLDWQAHCYCAQPSTLHSVCAELGLPLKCFPWTEALVGTGIERDTCYLVRPDGYVALASANDGAGKAIESYAAGRGLTLAPPHEGLRGALQATGRLS
ncbi:MAG: monooxygenase [Cereibacter sphaeroides]|uniref:Monooxygenase n=1 Tax=Cereibacter sphaeroides TaxID=1063 RepID=A0A2W5UAJ5_CERSP|nr:MAG: monooxygenase [Cereibacter sphaeroides]